MRIPRIAFALFLVVPPITQGQQETIHGSFRVVSLDRLTTKIFYQRGTADFEECRPLMNRFSDEYAFNLNEASGGFIRFYRKKSTLVSTAEAGLNDAVNYQLLGQVQVAAYGQYILLVAAEKVSCGPQR